MVIGSHMAIGNVFYISANDIDWPGQFNFNRENNLNICEKWSCLQYFLCCGQFRVSKLTLLLKQIQKKLTVINFVKPVK